jgi:adenylosuccinate synthase
MSVVLVVGAQYGSEGKGVIVSELAKAQDFVAHVRVGGPNAGHSHRAYDQKWAQRMLPVGWAHGSKAAHLILGRGAVVDCELLEHEILEAERFDPSVPKRVSVDYGATALRPVHRELEGEIHGDLHKRIGSTGEGVGLARQERLMRSITTPTMVGMREKDDNLRALYIETDTAHILDSLRRQNLNIMVEGTQGSGLSLIHGPWPFVTTADTNAAGLMADVGLAPGPDIEVGLVARTFPIRVAGNSGPMAGEITWEEMSTRTGKTVQERTTVTKLVRRIGEWDKALFQHAIMLNRPKWIALTFMDYIDPSLEGCRDWFRIMQSHKAAAFIAMVEEQANTPVRMIGTGGPEWSVAWRF